MTERRSPGLEARATSTTPIDDAYSTGSQQVSWWPVHEFLEAVLTKANVGPLPWAGAPSWCELADGDPRKLLALAVAGEHHVLRVEVAQTAHAQASRAIASTTDWPQVAQEIRSRTDFFERHPWLRRVAT